MPSAARSSRGLIQPGVRPGGWQTFSTIRDPNTGVELATCAMVDCAKMRDGWTARIDESLPRGRLCADYIRKVTRRPFTETRDESDQVTIFTFPPGTPCIMDRRDQRGQNLFAVGPHTSRIRKFLHVIADGGAADVQREIDRLGRPKVIERVHSRPADWAENWREAMTKHYDNRS